MLKKGMRNAPAGNALINTAVIRKIGWKKGIEITQHGLNQCHVGNFHTSDGRHIPLAKYTGREAYENGDEIQVMFIRI